MCFRRLRYRCVSHKSRGFKRISPDNRQEVFLTRHDTAQITDKRGSYAELDPFLRESFRLLTERDEIISRDGGEGETHEQMSVEKRKTRENKESRRTERAQKLKFTTAKSTEREYTHNYS